ncbi:hypothetical protein GUJ93_ZPchr0002g23586 [Zizania palustris]|uniref:Uncharacterized protein n=1 Tax=Zizania palustris TaxID=103762 RepID=A0A8J5S9Z1_ZIZPA|nr:hypothetical protein GUJ93_ZPchr0002g23586 [Zizania palustris]
MSMAQQTNFLCHPYLILDIWVMMGLCCCCSKHINGVRYASNVLQSYTTAMGYVCMHRLDLLPHCNETVIVWGGPFLGQHTPKMNMVAACEAASELTGRKIF